MQQRPTTIGPCPYCKHPMEYGDVLPEDLCCDACAQEHREVFLETGEWPEPPKPSDDR